MQILRKYRFHILIWTLFIIWESVLVGVINGGFGLPSVYVTHYSIIILLFYALAHLILPEMEKWPWRSILIPLFLIIFLAAYVTIHWLGDVMLTLLGFLPVRENYGLNESFVWRNLYRGLFFTGFSTGYYYLRNYLEGRKQLDKLKLDHLQSIIVQKETEQRLTLIQNAYLKAQVNPHFLFNTLDFIYYHTNKHSEVAGDAIIRLSSMMRFALDSEHMGDTILIGEELEQVENLIHLNELRKKGRKLVELKVSEQVRALHFIPLVLLTLVENIFKHGDLSQEPAVLQLNMEANQLVMTTVNQIASHTSNSSHHTGLSNIQRRLEFAYGNHHTFHHKVAEGNFQLIIRVELQALSTLKYA